MDNETRKLRAKLAKARFYEYTTNGVNRQDKYGYLVCDSTAPKGSKVVGKFQTARMSSWFVKLLRGLFISGKIS